VAAYGGGHLSLWDTKTGAEVRRGGLPSAFPAALVWVGGGRGVAAPPGAAGSGWGFTDQKNTPKTPLRAPPRPPPPRGGRPPAHVPRGGRPADNESDWCSAVSPDGKTLAVGRGGTRLKETGVNHPIGGFGPIREFGPVVQPLERKDITDKDRAILLRPLKAG